VPACEIELLLEVQQPAKRQSLESAQENNMLTVGSTACVGPRL